MKEMAMLAHQHYNYRMKFKSINRASCYMKCDLSKQRKGKAVEITGRNLRRRMFLRIILLTANGRIVHSYIRISRNPSKPVVLRQKEIFVPTAQYLNLRTSKTEYIGDFVRYLAAGLIPVVSFRQFVDEIKTAYRTQVIEVAQAQDTPANSILPQLVSFQSVLDKDVVTMDSLLLDKEIQFNSWLFHMIDKELQPHGFTVEPSRVNKQIHPNCCEFSTSISDCVIFHPNTLFTSVSTAALTIIIHDDSAVEDTRVTDMNINDVCEGGKVEINACAFEMKVERANEAAINECSYNMFGTAARLVTCGLELGKIVTQARIYGVVVAMRKPDEANIMELSLDFEEGRFNFKISTKKYNFRDAVNMVLDRLLTQSS